MTHSLLIVSQSDPRMDMRTDTQAIYKDKPVIVRRITFAQALAMEAVGAQLYVCWRDMPDYPSQYTFNYIGAQKPLELYTYFILVEPD